MPKKKKEMYSNHEFYEMVRSYILSGESLRGARRLYEEEIIPRLRNQGIINPSVPNCRTILAVKQRLLDHGQFITPTHAQGAGRPRLAVEVERDILDFFEQSPGSSTQDAVRRFGVSQHTVWKLLQEYNADGLSPNDSKLNLRPQRTCSRCKRSIQHTTGEDQTKKLIANVYHYFEREYEELQNQFGDLDLTLLSKFRQRTALATGVSEKKILEILKEEEEEAKKEEETQKTETKQEKSRIRARKRPVYMESSTTEEESSDNNLSDDELPTPERGTQNETDIEPLVVKFDPDCDEEQVQTKTELVQVKADPLDVDEETYEDIPAIKESMTKRKRSKTPRKEVTSQRQSIHGEPPTSGASSSVQLTNDEHETQNETEFETLVVKIDPDCDESSLLRVDEVKVEKIDIDEEGIS